MFISVRPLVARASFARLASLLPRFRSLKEGIAILAAASAFLFGAADGVFALSFEAGSIEVDQPWARAAPGGAKVAGGYVVIRNHGTAPDRLLSVTAEVAGHAGIHEMTMKDGIMVMRPLPDGLIIPANGEVTLAPGADHLMFLDLKRQLKQGGAFLGTLTFEKAGAINVTFSINAIGATDAGRQGADHSGEAH
jgi:copper(I)-binding protein